MMDIKEEIYKDRFGEKCGVLAVWSKDKLAPFYARQGLSALQHRGQESAGISIYKNQGKILTYKNVGLVPIVLTNEVLQNLGDSRCAIAHNRYSTSGSTSSVNAQPFTIENNNQTLSIGHNGNIPDCSGLKRQLISETENAEQNSDTFIVAKLLTQERRKYKSWDQTLLNVLPWVKGAFCFTILTSDGTLYGVRDPYGIRPFCLGKLEKGWIMASESVAIDVTGGEFLRDIKPGEIVKINYNGKISSLFFGEPKRPQKCLFEYIYFSRPDSFENGIRVRAAREASGRLLGNRILSKGIEADVVVPVYESGYPAAKGAAQVLGIPLVDAITVSHYVGRTFIQPGHKNRISAVNGKYNIVPDEITGKRIIVVDDSVIRLTTSKGLFRGLQEAGAKKIYMVSASPPVVNHCDMGIDMKSKKELPASRWEHKSFEVIEENVSRFIGADGMVYLPIDDIARAIGGIKEDFYHFPFGGPHPIRDKQYKFPKMKKIIKDKVKIAVLISGSGTNLQVLIDAIKQGEMDAEIVLVISNNKGAKGIERAKKNNIPVALLPFSGKVSKKELRMEYEQMLAKHIRKAKSDIIVLAGWMLILGDAFLKEMAGIEVPVINLHPALLTDKLDDHIMTSRGRIPVIRGANAIQEAFKKNLLTSGVSVHQVLAKNYFDMGPVIMKEEVKRKKEYTIEIFEQKIHEAEHRVLPSALNRVMHMMRSGIDVCKGNIYW